MLRYNQKTGNISMTPAALAGFAVILVGFGGWMTKMQMDVSQVSTISERLTRVESILIHNHIDLSKVPTWPDSPRAPFYPALPSYPSSVAGTGKRESVSVTLP